VAGVRARFQVWASAINGDYREKAQMTEKGPKGLKRLNGPKGRFLGQSKPSASGRGCARAQWVEEGFRLRMATARQVRLRMATARQVRLRQGPRRDKAAREVSGSKGSRRITRIVVNINIRILSFDNLCELR
jgi:hypothetical protein